ncbi:hypothetical protein FRC09_006029 [Ceratobasidium sp. 395]|nr:hypothetical protein FRC09_006029 [Ceratobasidium sp. 395]
MSQSQGNEGLVLIGNVQMSIDLFLSSIDDLVRFDIDPDSLDEETEEKLSVIAEFLNEVPARARELKRKFPQMSEQQQKRRKTITDGMFGSESYADELFAVTVGETLELGDFIRTLSGNDMTMEELLIDGFYDALSTFNFDADALERRIRLYSLDASTASIAEMITSMEPGAGFLTLHNDYGAITNKLTVPGPFVWFQQMGIKIHALSFAVGWSKYTGKGAKSKKKSTVEKLYKGNEGSKMSDIERKSTAFKTYKSRFRDNLKGINRLLNAYKTLGSVVILHPHLSFKSFCDARVGPNALRTVHCLGEKLKDGNRLSEMELARQSLLWATLKELAPDSELKEKVKELFTQAESAVVGEDL